MPALNPSDSYEVIILLVGIGVSRKRALFFQLKFIENHLSWEVDISSQGTTTSECFTHLSNFRTDCLQVSSYKPDLLMRCHCVVLIILVGFSNHEVHVHTYASYCYFQLGMMWYIDG